MRLRLSISTVRAESSCLTMLLPRSKKAEKCIAVAKQRAEMNKFISKHTLQDAISTNKLTTYGFKTTQLMNQHTTSPKLIYIGQLQPSQTELVLYYCSTNISPSSPPQPHHVLFCPNWHNSAIPQTRAPKPCMDTLHDPPCLKKMFTKNSTF